MFLTHWRKGLAQRTNAMVARIYKPAQTAMQSGPARAKEWVLEYEPETPREIDPLMGWTSSGDMKSQISLSFDTKEEAMAYAERNGIPYHVIEPTLRRLVRKSYADNFRFGRRGSWTH
jgi:ETC complex I subunit conserved region